MTRYWSGARALITFHKWRFAPASTAADGSSRNSTCPEKNSSIRDRESLHASYCWLVGWIMLDELIDNNWNSSAAAWLQQKSPQRFFRTAEKKTTLWPSISNPTFRRFDKMECRAFELPIKAMPTLSFLNPPPKKHPGHLRVAGFVFFMGFPGFVFRVFKIPHNAGVVKTRGNQTKTSIETLHCSLQFCLSDHKAFKFVPDSASSHHYRCLPAFQHLLLKAQDDPANSSLSYPTQSLKYLWCGHKTLEIRQFLHMFWSNGPNMEMDNRWWSFPEMPSRRP